MTEEIFCNELKGGIGAIRDTTDTTIFFAYFIYIRKQQIVSNFLMKRRLNSLLAFSISLIYLADLHILSLSFRGTITMINKYISTSGSGKVC